MWLGFGMTTPVRPKSTWHSGADTSVPKKWFTWGDITCVTRDKTQWGGTHSLLVVMGRPKKWKGLTPLCLAPWDVAQEGVAGDFIPIYIFWGMFFTFWCWCVNLLCQADLKGLYLILWDKKGVYRIETNKKKCSNEHLLCTKFIMCQLMVREYDRTYKILAEHLLPFLFCK